MRTKVINITEFDQVEAAKKKYKGTRVVYGFRQDDLDNPDRTIQNLVANPSNFRYDEFDESHEYEVILTKGQNARFLAYLQAGQYRCADFAQEEPPEYLLAFSYGENPDVNMQLADVVETALQNIPSLKAFVQWEIANILYERNRTYRHTVTRIDLDCDRDYITSVEVVEKFERSIGKAGGVRLFVVCQAWHAPRCIYICKKRGFNVVRGEFIDDFSRSDPQHWVRNWLAWVFKEGSR